MNFGLRSCRVFFTALLLTAAAFPLFAQSSDSIPSQKFQDQKFQTAADWDALAASVTANPADKDIVRSAESAVSQGLPDEWQTEWTAALPLDSVTLADGLGVQLTPKAYLPTPTTEPQSGAVFTRISYFYVPSDTAGANQLLCRLHYTEDSDATLAGRMGALLTLLHRTQVAETGRAPDGGTETFDVWLCRSGRAGGEEWRRNIYFYDLDTPRSSIEWVREIAHEYSHMVLPAIGGYREPEYWANGYYGERLLVRWLARTPGGSALVEKVWGDFSGWPNFERLLITPAIALYKKHGPDPALAAQADKEGMRYLIGQILVFDDKYGPKRLADAFDYLPHAHEARGPDMGTAFGQELAQNGGHGL